MEAFAEGGPADPAVRTTAEARTAVLALARDWIKTVALAEPDPALITALATLLHEANQNAMLSVIRKELPASVLEARRAACAALGIERLDTPLREIESQIKAAVAGRARSSAHFTGITPGSGEPDRDRKLTMALTISEIENIATDVANLKSALAARGLGENTARELAVAAMPVIVSLETGMTAARRKRGEPVTEPGASTCQWCGQPVTVAANQVDVIVRGLTEARDGYDAAVRCPDSPHERHETVNPGELPGQDS